MAQFPPYTTSGNADSTGTLHLSFKVRSSVRVRVPQITSEMATGAGAACGVRLNGWLIAPLVPTGDAAAGDPAIWWTPGDDLAVVWTGAPVGASGSAVFVYDDGSS